MMYAVQLAPLAAALPVDVVIATLGRPEVTLADRTVRELFSSSLFDWSTDFLLQPAYALGYSSEWIVDLFLSGANP
jgi:hypothetical protein